ncbi:MAG TPA: oligopeptide transporter, OPT family [Oligoflexia bacterium]|nr:oligopeptide transporter, OPT family [Oligoflexia bacterium]HMR25344.1 oligopeptide transporter, OPT family [Oligoflexia bacterium]
MNKDFKPHIPAQQNPPEFTVKAVLVGCVAGCLFGAANAYLGLRVGLTISTSIPIAVIAVLAFFALPPFGKLASILETNIAQTVGSASSSLASGLIFTVPALFLWQQNPTLGQIVLVSVSGGILGILFMIPLRRTLIRDEHETLPYPEGTACAKVMIAAEKGGNHAMPVFKGILIGGFLKFVLSWAKVIKDDFHINLPFIPKAQFGLEFSPALLGVGFILGLRIATVMVAGSALAWFVIIPAIAIWGQNQTAPLYPETIALITDMSPGQIWTRYVRYIGAGAVAFGGLLSLLKTLPTIFSSFRQGIADFKNRVPKPDETQISRHERDLSLKTSLIIMAIIIALLIIAPTGLTYLPGFGAKIVSVILAVVFAFFFVTVSSRIVGMVGVSSNPTSGMTIATLIATCGIFYMLNWMGSLAMAQALIIGTLVATAASIAGDTSQDLKSGFLLGSTPKFQQIGEILGVVTSVTFVCFSLYALAKTYGFGTQELPAPQAMLMKVVIEGILSTEHSLPWSLVAIGAGIAAIAALFRLPVLAFAVGVYLPLSSMFPIFMGGLIRYWVEKRKSSENGILLCSGFVGGEGLFGVGIAFYALLTSSKPQGWGSQWAGALESWLPLICMLALSFFVGYFSVKGKQNNNSNA